MPDPRAPWSGVTFVGAYWNCPERLEALLTFVRPWFKNIVAVVQVPTEDPSESELETYEVAKRLANVAIKDVFHGRGDPSITLAVASVTTPWAFVISDDEKPTEELLDSFQDLADRLKAEQKEGAWFHFVSSIDGHNFTREQDEHLRFFLARIPWPSSPHARPMTNRTLRWRPEGGVVHHDRTLDEMMQDYLRKFDICAARPEWAQQQAHNVRMMQGACGAVANIDGWDYVQSFPWWPRMLEVAYGGGDPAPAAEAAKKAAEAEKQAAEAAAAEVADEADNEEPPQEEASTKRSRKGR